MSFDQNYQVQSVKDLLLKLMNLDTERAVIAEAKKRGIKIKKIEEIVLDNNPWSGEVLGQRVTLSDGKVYVPKLTMSIIGDNYGVNIYQYHPENKKVKVNKVYQNKK